MDIFAYENISLYITEYGSLKPENFAGAGDMQDSIYIANKKRDREIAHHVKRKFEVSICCLDVFLFAILRECVCIL